MGVLNELYLPHYRIQIFRLNSEGVSSHRIQRRLVDPSFFYYPPFVNPPIL